MTARPALPLPPVTATLFIGFSLGPRSVVPHYSPFRKQADGRGSSPPSREGGGRPSWFRAHQWSGQVPNTALTCLSLAHDQGRSLLLYADPLGFRGDGRHTAPQTSATVLSAYRSSRFRAGATLDVNVLMQAMPFGSVWQRYSG